MESSLTKSGLLLFKNVERSGVSYIGLVDFFCVFLEENILC